MKNWSLILILSFFMIKCHSQSKNENETGRAQNEYKFINNWKIKYSIVLIACDTCAPITNIGYRVDVELTPDQKDKIKKISCDVWISLLKDTTSDWAANLILYDIFGRDALSLSRRNSRDTWVKFFKREYLIFWKKKLCPSTFPATVDANSIKWSLHETESTRRIVPPPRFVAMNWFFNEV